MDLGAATPLMWVTYFVILVAIVFYIGEWLPIQLTSAGVLIVLMIIFHFIPGDNGESLLQPSDLLAGFADPALITVLSMLVIGEALVRTGALHHVAHDILHLTRGSGKKALALMLVFAAALSGFSNNTPIVVIFIPMLQSLADKLRLSASKVMIPLSYAAILGGMTTLIGSSTNLLVSTSLQNMGEEPFSMFSFTLPGLIAAIAGLIYVSYVAPLLLPERKVMSENLVDVTGRQFLTQLTIGPSSLLAGATAQSGRFNLLQDVSVQMVQQGEHAELPPFDNLTFSAGDIIVVGGTRKKIIDLLTRDSGLYSEIELRPGDQMISGDPRDDKNQQVLVEIMVAPYSRMIGRNLEQINFRRRFGCIVLGIQRRSRMMRRITENRLEAGDVLLILGKRRDVQLLDSNKDIVLIEGSTSELPNRSLARRALVAMFCIIALIATNIVPVVLAALSGAIAMLALGCLNIRQASRAIDGRLVFLVAAALAMGQSLQITGGAEFVSHAATSIIGTAYPTLLLSVFFLIVAIVTNVLSNTAAAVLFTPIAVSMAYAAGVSPVPFAIAVVIAANCSFASPIGYQTNLLVMGPGHYRFSDFIRVGAPLMFLIWIVFTIFAKLYYL